MTVLAFSESDLAT